MRGFGSGRCSRRKEEIRSMIDYWRRGCHMVIGYFKGCICNFKCQIHNIEKVYTITLPFNDMASEIHFGTSEPTK